MTIFSKTFLGEWPLWPPCALGLPSEFFCVRHWPLSCDKFRWVWKRRDTTDCELHISVQECCFGKIYIHVYCSLRYLKLPTSHTIFVINLLHFKTTRYRRLRTSHFSA